MRLFNICWEIGEIQDWHLLPIYEGKGIKKAKYIEDR